MRRQICPPADFGTHVASSQQLRRSIHDFTIFAFGSCRQNLLLGDPGARGRSKLRPPGLDLRNLLRARVRRSTIWPIPWIALAGVGLFVSTMATGYYYNITFVQLGLLDLGTNHIGLTEPHVTWLLAIFALVTFMASGLTALLMGRFGWTRRMRVKLRLAAMVALFQTALTLVSAGLHDGAGLMAWLLAAGVIIGVGIPASFSLAVDLVPVRHRGGVAALITALAYFAAPLGAYPWTFEHTRTQLLPILAVGALVVGGLAFIPNRWVDRWAVQHRDPAYGVGRYTRQRRAGSSALPIMLAALMFGVFFIDSLGFLRLSGESVYMQGAWLSDQVANRLFISLVHVAGAWIAGVLYSAFDFRTLFLWAFGLFALVHLMYTFPLRFGSPTSVLAEPMVYALAVSIYTVLNFALWADLSTPATVARNAALGVGFSGWTATFASTSLALAWRSQGMPLVTHLRLVDATAVVLFLALLLAVYISPGRPPSTADQVA